MGFTRVIYIWLNALPILLATLASVAVGFAYHRLIAHGQPDRNFPLFAIPALAWFAAILAGALILAPAQASGWVMAIGTAVVIWAGFVLPTVIVSLDYRNASPRMIAGDAACWLAMMLAQAVVLKAIGLVPPPA